MSQSFHDPGLAPCPLTPLSFCILHVYLDIPRFVIHFLIAERFLSFSYKKKKKKSISSLFINVIPDCMKGASTLKHGGVLELSVHKALCLLYKAK